MKFFPLKTYKHLFFDLDHTLWDFEKNAEETILVLYNQFELAKFGQFSSTDFYKKYSYINHRMWRQYHEGKITQQELRVNRFEQTLLKLGLTPEQIPVGLPEAFTTLCPQKTAVFPYTYQVLNYLQKKYTLHIITNGFKDVQKIKMASSDLHGYFTEVITSECINCSKPDRKIFEHALNRANVKAVDSLMIGDSLEADILGAKNAGIDQIYFNPAKKRHYQKVTYEISCLSELMRVL
ncbi:YjjG family noncanonical pyrimidine nucleotidase [Adhaeribacter radiodurans]|uniref:Noncanonical pyrimidine nucleotidase, YjjG family n=1 Tax=Adhaeribacter radiodurans TaxID=2745197 RepID=A0A7L7L2Z6_9BACT|nr:YjjG family noncanonical pyrimidine nucleotidase [Adhaeribacter radiodurans]QMU27172.1 noncanonical pyrimidine nucleotidase, YjjG family [Adhaeribacter radiodurans]